MSETTATPKTSGARLKFAPTAHCSELGPYLCGRRMLLSKTHTSRMMDTAERSMSNNEANRANVIAMRYKKVATSLLTSALRSMKTKWAALSKTRSLVSGIASARAAALATGT